MRSYCIVSDLGTSKADNAQICLERLPELKTEAFERVSTISHIKQVLWYHNDFARLSDYRSFSSLSSLHDG